MLLTYNIQRYKVHKATSFCRCQWMWFGAESLLRHYNFDGAFHCSFVNGKLCVAPLKQTTFFSTRIDRASVAVRADKILKSDLNVPIHESVFWIYSMLDTLYLRNTPPRFHNCVIKRLAVIHEGSYPTNRNISIPNKTLLILHQEACPQMIFSKEKIR